MLKLTLVSKPPASRCCHWR